MIMATPPRRYEKVGAQLSQYIADRGLRPGSRLPAEVELAKVFGVSRPTIREAMISLEVAGEVEIKIGSGAFVCDPKAVSLLLQSAPGPFEILRARTLIEGGTASTAAICASTVDLLKIEQIIRTMRHTVRARNSTLSLDLDFHVAVAEASKNSALTSIIYGLWTELFSPKHSHITHGFGLAKNQVTAIAGYDAVFEAIAGRNSQEARLAMKRHLQNLENYLLGEADSPERQVRTSRIDSPPVANLHEQHHHAVTV